MIRRIFSFPVFLLLIWAYLAINSHAWAKIEGKLFPVISDFTITQMEKNPDDYLFTVLSGHFIKLRNCKFSGANLIIKEDDLESVTEITFRDVARVRKPGKQEYGPWETRVGIDSLANADITVEHNCDKPNLFGIERRVITRTSVTIDIQNP